MPMYPALRLAFPDMSNRGLKSANASSLNVLEEERWGFQDYGIGIHCIFVCKGAELSAEHKVKLAFMPNYRYKALNNLDEPVLVIPRPHISRQIIQEESTLRWRQFV